MRRVLFGFVTVATFVVAGLYRSTPLLTVSIAELLLPVCMKLLVRYQGKRLEVAFAQEHQIVRRGSGFVCRCLIHNTGRLPVARFRMTVRCGEGVEEGQRKDPGWCRTVKTDHGRAGAEEGQRKDPGWRRTV